MLALYHSKHQATSGLTIGGKQSDSGSLGSGTASTPYTMYVVFRIIRIVIIENVSDVLNIFAKVSIAFPQRKYDDSVRNRV